MPVFGDSGSEGGEAAAPEAPVRPRLCRGGRPRRRRGRPPRDPAPAAGAKYKGQIPAERIIKWVTAAGFLKANSKIKPAAKAFAEALSRDEDESAQLLLRSPAVCREVLRAARVRIDVVAMHGFRAWWRSLDHASGRVAVNLWVDGSPQWRGVEMYATSAEVWNGDEVRRWILPCVALRSEQMDAISKLIALMWSIFLVIGPEEEVLRGFFASVSGICTDHGTESQLIDMPDIVHDFMSYVGGHPLGFPVEGYLFQHGIASQGWKHVFDGALCRSLGALRWWPKFLARLKALTAIMRDRNKNKAIQRMFAQKGMDYLVECVRDAHLPNFAQWRWTTLDGVVRGIDGFLDSLRANVDFTLFNRSRDPTGVRLAEEACKDPIWRHQYSLVRFCAKSTGRLLRWGGSCDCHDDDTPCAQKGRRIPLAFNHACEVMQGWLEEADGWTTAEYGDNRTLLNEAQGTVRALYDIVQQKVSHYDELPWLLSRLDQAGVPGRCLWQYGMAPPVRHHRVTRRFLAEGSPFREEINRMAAEGVPPGEALLREIVKLQRVPLNDSIAEGPHATMGRIIQSARSATWAWHASTLRLSQNLTDITEWQASLGFNVQQAWDAWSSILKVRRGEKRFLSRRVKKSKKKVIGDIYHMDFGFELEPPRAHGPPADDPAGGPPPPPGRRVFGDDSDEDPAKGAAPSGPTPPAPPAGEARDSDNAPPADDAEVMAIHPELDLPEHRWASHKDERTLLRQWLEQSLPLYGYVTVPMYFQAVDADEDRLLVFQVLRLSRVAVVVKTWSQDAEPPALYDVAIQPFEVWAPPEDPREPVPELQIYVAGAPTNIDLLEACRADRRLLQHMRQWQKGPSDVEGCFLLSNPALLQPPLPLSSPKIPVLTLMEELLRLGAVEVRKKVSQKPGEALVQVDVRRLPSKRYYLQCLLAREELFGRGLLEIPSTAMQKAYLCCLRSERLDAFNWAGEGQSHDEALKKLGEGETTCVALRKPQEARGLPGLLAAPPPRAIHGDSEEEAPPMLVDAASSSSSTSSSGSSGSSSSASSSDSESSGGIGPSGAASSGMPAPKVVLGRTLTLEQHRGRPGYRVTCPYHAGCKLFRTIGLWGDDLGPQAAEWYLATWLAAGEDEAFPNHKEYKPTLPQVRDYKERKKTLD